MFTKRLSLLIAAGVLLLGTTAPAQTEDNEKMAMSQEQVRTAEQTQVRAGVQTENAPGDQTMTQDRLQTRDRLKDGTCDHDQDRLQMRDRDMIHTPGAGSGTRGGK